MGVISAGAGARAGVEGAAAAIADNDPYFKALQQEMSDKGFLVTRKPLSAISACRALK